MTAVDRVDRAFSRLPREQRVADIMLAARKVFADKGFREASVSEIAELAGVVEGSVYRYFEHKRALLVKVVEDWYEELFADYDQHLAMIEGTWKRLRFMVWKHLSIIQKEPALCRLVFDELRPGEDYRSTTVFELNRRYTHRTIEILREGIARGEIDPDADLGLVRDMVYGCVEHHTWAFLRGEGQISPDVAADGITGIIRSGLAIGSVARARGAKSTATSEREHEDRAVSRAVRRLEDVAERLERVAAIAPAKPSPRSHVPQSARRKSR